jgi:hypothetical protein
MVGGNRIFDIDKSLLFGRTTRFRGISHLYLEVCSVHNVLASDLI